MKNENLFLGVKKTDITPRVGCRLFGYVDDLYSDSVHDGLDATVFLLRQGDVFCAAVSITVVALTHTLSERIRQGIADACGMEKANVFLACTHTHSGPATFGMDSGWGGVDEEYCNTVLIPRITEAAKEAAAAMIPVTVGYASGESDIGVNRRELTPENKIILGQNPWGPYNPKMTVISFADESGRCAANIVHYGMHGTCAGHNTEISQDWAGVMVRRMEKLTGGITAFFNGPEGDVGPRLTNGRTTGICDIEFAMETGGRAAFDAMQVYRQIRSFTTPRLSAHSGTLRLPLQPRLSREEALRRREELLARQSSAAERALCAHYQRVADSHGTDCADRDFFELEQNVITLGSLVLAGFPYELFSEIGMRIQRAAGELDVLPIALANGVIGYFPTEDALCRGGYEVVMFGTTNLQEFVHDVDWHLVKETLRNIGAKGY